MKYELTVANEDAWGPYPPYQIDRILPLGERVLVGYFDDHVYAKACMETLKHAITWREPDGKS